MKQIETEFKGKGEVSGINFKQVKRSGPWVIYERSDGYYEVIKLREQKESFKTIKGIEIHFEHKEVYPNGERWDGSCLGSLDRAKEIFDSKTEI